MATTASAKTIVTKAINAAEVLLRDPYLVEPLIVPENEEELRKFVHEQESKLKSYIEKLQLHNELIEKKYEKLSEMIEEEDQESLSPYLESTEDTRSRLDTMRLSLSTKLHSIESQKDMFYRALGLRKSASAATVPATQLDDLQLLTVLERMDRLRPQESRHHLPELPIPQFHGNPWEFGSFWFGFQRLVHDQPDLSDYEKLSYLRQAVKNDPLRLINTIPDNENSYTAAVNLLKKKYGNKNAIVHQLHAKIKQLRASDSRVHSARGLHENLQQLVPLLTEHGDSTNNRSFLTDLLSKFPERIRDKALEKIVDSDSEQLWTWESISSILTKVIDRCELLEAEKGVFRTESGQGRKIRPPSGFSSCFLCGKGHPNPEDCRTIPPERRRSLMRDKNLCFRCGANHDYRNCTARCNRCQGPHHAAICTGQQRREDRPRFAPETNVPQRNHESVDQRPRYRQDERWRPQNSNSTNTRATNNWNPQGNRNNWNTSAYPRQQQRPNGGSQDSRNGQGTRSGEQGRNFSTAHTNGGNQLRTNRNPETVNAISRSEMIIESPPAPVFRKRLAKGGIILTGSVPVADSKGTLIPTNVLFDSGSSLTFIDASFVKEMNLPIVDHSVLMIQTFGQQPSEQTYAFTEIMVVDLDGVFYTVKAALVPTTFFSSTIVPELTEEDQAVIQASRATLSDKNPKEREERYRILLGTDYMWNFFHRKAEVALDLPSGMSLIPSSFGYLRSGQSRNHTTQHLNTILEVNNPGEVSEAEQYWMTELLGTREYSEEYLNENEQRVTANAHVQQEFEELARRIDGRYYISFPQRKECIDQLSRNDRMAFRRLKNMCDTYRENEWLMEKIKTNFEEQLQKGMIERVPREEIEARHPTFYAPFHPVTSLDKESTKVRVVFDASAREKGFSSLNEVLHQGPNNLPHLTGILLRCRTSAILVSADVEKAFLMIKLNQLDKDLTRFMLPVDWTSPISRQNIAHYRHTVLPFGINCSPYLLSAVLKLHLDQGYGGAARDDLLYQMYVDNVFMGAENMTTALEKIADAREFFSEMRMNLRQFMTNNSAAINHLPDDKISENEKPKILGIPWNPVADKLSVEIEYKTYHASLTRRMVSRQIASIFDPMGYAAPLTLKAKLFLQQLFVNKDLKWDHPLTDQQHEEWNRIVEEVNLHQIVIPRYLGTGSHKRSRLVVFTDASTEAYGACAYLVTEGVPHLIMSRTKLAPLRTKATVPKLELLGLTLGFRLLMHVIPELLKSKFIILDKDVHVLSDSTAALGWLKLTRENLRARKMGILVYNRMEEIHRIITTMTRQFRFFAQHVATEDNPADHCSRGLTSAQFDASNWLHGPGFLSTEPSSWPASSERFRVGPIGSFNYRPESPWFDPITGDYEKTQEPEEDWSAEDIPQELREKEHVCLVQEKPPDAHCIQWTQGVNTQFTEAQPTRLTKLYKSGALIARFVKKCLVGNTTLRERLEGTIPEIAQISTDGDLTTADIQTGRNLIVKLHQCESFEQLSAQQLHKIYAAEKDEEGIIRIRGRIGKSQLPAEAHHPILISGKHPFAEIIIEHFHRKAMHYGIAHTLAAIRSQFWITKPRTRIKQVLSNCRKCRTVNRRPFGYPPVADLPSRRLTATRPFQHVGLDYLGPLTTRESKNEEQKKRWVILLTCLTTRAIHLDLVDDLSTVAFISALQRFFAETGIPETITSDNAPQFHLGERILNTILSSTANTANQVQRFMTTNEIKWHFISAFAPWQGGAYERLCGSVKSALYKILRRQRPKYDALRTILKEIQGALNKRPLTYVDNSDDWSLITPSHFLQQGVHVVIPRVILSSEDENYIPPLERYTLRTRREALQALDTHQEATRKIWEIFQQQYITSLAEAQKIDRKYPYSFTTKAPTVGEVVMLKDANRPRYTWPLAKVLEPMKGADGRIRNVRLITASNKEITRPVSLLIPLELSTAVETNSRIYAPLSPQNICRRYNLRARKPKLARRTPESDEESESEEERAYVNAVTTNPYGNNEPYDKRYPFFIDDDVNTKVPRDVLERLDYQITDLHSRRVYEVNHLKVTQTTRPLLPAKKRPKIRFLQENTGIKLTEIPRQQGRDYVRLGRRADMEFPREQADLLLPIQGLHEERRSGVWTKRGTQPLKTFWTFLALIALHIASTTAHQFECIPGGVAFNTSAYSKLSVCTQDMCIKADPRSSEILLPPSYVNKNHKITVKFSDESQRTSLYELDCPAVDNFCDHIRCTFCSDNLANPDCHPRSVAILSILGIYVITAIIIGICTTTCRPASVIWTLTKLVFWPGLLMLRGIRKILQLRRQPHARHDRRDSLSMVLVRIGLLIGILTLHRVCHGCDHVEMMEQDVTHCTGENCTTTHLQTIWFNPTNPAACIHVTRNETTTFYAKLHWKRTTLRCTRVIDTFTRSVHHFVASSKRCARTGSCVPEFCGNVKTNTTIEELGRYNEKPGKTYCTESTGFIAGGCFFPSPGCLFWRETLLPDDTTIYNVFHCSAWKKSALIEATIMENGTTEVVDLPLIPGRPKTVNGHRILITEIEHGEYPILNAHFLSDRNTSAFLTSTDEIYLWCDSAENADLGLCSALPNCRCHPAETTMNCDCGSTNLTRLFNDPDRRLPLHQPELLLRDHQGTIVAEIMSTGSVLVEWNWTIPNSHSTLSTTQRDCQLTISELTGCYACTEGALAEAMCTSHAPLSTTITCADQTFAIECDINGKRTNLRVFSNYAKLDTTCATDCTPHSLPFRGVLRYYAPARGMLQPASWSGNEREVAMPDVHHFLSSVAEYIGIRVLFLMLFGTILLVLYVYLKGQPWFLTSRLFAINTPKQHQL